MHSKHQVGLLVAGALIATSAMARVGMGASGHSDEFSVPDLPVLPRSSMVQGTAKKPEQGAAQAATQPPVAKEVPKKVSILSLLEIGEGDEAEVSIAPVASPDKESMVEAPSPKAVAEKAPSEAVLAPKEASMPLADVPKADVQVPPPVKGTGAMLPPVVQTAPVQKVEVQPEVQPVVIAAPPPVIDKALHIKQGDLIADKLIAWAKSNGYSLTWYASTFRATADFDLDASFDDTLEAIAGAMRNNRVYLNFDVFQNKAVRVTEMKQ